MRMRQLAICSAVFVFSAPGLLKAEAPLPEQAVKEVQIEAKAYEQAAVPEWAEQTPLPAPENASPLVYRLLETQLMAAGTPVAFIHQALQVNDASSLSSAGQISINFVPEYQRLKLHYVYVHRASEKADRTASVSPRFLQREKGLESGVYSDVVTASLLVNDLRVGDTIEYAYSVEGQNPVFDNKYFDYASWDQDTLTLQRRVILKYPKDRAISWRLVSEDRKSELEPRISEVDGLKRVEFNAERLPAITPEKLLPVDYVAYRWLEFSEFPDWAAVASWANALFKIEDVQDLAFRDVTEKIKSLPTSEERVVAALEFVQTDIRYFSVALGESSHRPTRPDVVLQRRFGDCKDKSLLLVTLLRQLGIESHAVLLSVARLRGLEKSLPSPLSFDHAIVQASLNGKTYFLDPTRLGQHGRLDHMGQANSGAQVLVVAPETKELTLIPPPTGAAVDSSDITESANLPKVDGEGDLEIRQTWTGVSAENLRVLHQQIPSDRFNKFFSEALTQRFPEARMSGEPLYTDDQKNNVVAVVTKYAVPKMAFENAGNWFVRIDPNNVRGFVAPAPASTRQAPMALPKFPYKATYTFTMKMPDNIDIWATPSQVDIKGKHFEFDLETRYRGNVVRTTVLAETRADRVEASDIKKYSDDLRSSDKFPLGAIVIPGKLVKVAAAKPKSSKTPSQKVEEWRREEIANATKAIESGQLSGADLAKSYCTRANGYTDLREFGKALADAGKAVEVAPGSYEGLTCRAEAYFAMGEFEKSIDDYGKILSLGAPAARALQARGISRYYAGQLAEAADDFTKATDIADLGVQDYVDLWLTWTYQRLGKPLPSAVATRAAASKNGTWPRPALAMLNGELPPDELLKIINNKDGMEGLTTATEGYFYLGHYFLGKGDNVKAREYFAKVLKLKAIHYTEYTASVHELKKLEAGPGVETGALTDDKKDSPSNLSSNPPVKSAVPQSSVTASPAKAAAATSKVPRAKPASRKTSDSAWNTNPLGRP